MQKRTHKIIVDFKWDQCHERRRCTACRCALRQKSVANSSVIDAYPIKTLTGGNRQPILILPDSQLWNWAVHLQAWAGTCQGVSPFVCKAAMAQSNQFTC